MKPRPTDDFADGTGSCDQMQKSTSLHALCVAAALTCLLTAMMSFGDLLALLTNDIPLRHIAQVLVLGESTMDAWTTGRVKHMSSDEARAAPNGTVVLAEEPTVLGPRWYFIKDTQRTNGGSLLRGNGFELGQIEPAHGGEALEASTRADKP